MLKRISWNHLLLLFALPQLALKALWAPGEDWLLPVELVFLFYLFVLLITAIQRTLNKDFNSLLKLAGVVIIVYFFPVDFLVGYTRFLSSYGFRRQVVAELNAGKYDSAITSAQGGAFIHVCRNEVSVYRRGSLRMVYIPIKEFGECENSEYYGFEYIAGETSLEQDDVANFLRPAQRIPLGSHWYWVHDYPDYTPGP